MGDDRRAAAALAHMPRWVAVHENTLAKLDVIVAVAGSYGHDVDVALEEMDEARAERDRAIGVQADAAPPSTGTQGPDGGQG